MKDFIDNGITYRTAFDQIILRPTRVIVHKNDAGGVFIEQVAIFFEESLAQPPQQLPLNLSGDEYCGTYIANMR